MVGSEGMAKASGLSKGMNGRGIATMNVVTVKEHCDCPPGQRLRLCPECPWRRAAERQREAEELGLDIPTFLRRQGSAGPKGGGCCGGRG